MLASPTGANSGPNCSTSDPAGALEEAAEYGPVFVCLPLKWEMSSKILNTR